jgi:glucose-1-phosphate adenylyltransferase
VTNSFALVFANIDNSTMDLFTAVRSVGALPFGARYRLIDFTLSNLVNSGVDTVGVAVREKYQSLLDHIGTARDWDLDRRSGGLTFLPPFAFDQETPYDTKLKALIGSESYLRNNHAEYVFLCEPDVVGNADLDGLWEAYMENGDDITYLTVRCAGINHHGSFKTGLRTDGNGRVTEILKADDPAAERLSVGVCVMKRSLLLDLTVAAKLNNYKYFDNDMIPRLMENLKIGVFDHEGYVAKIRTRSDYYNASMDLLKSDVRRDVFFRYGHIFTKTYADVPVLYGLDSDVKESLIADGSSVGGTVHQSIIFRRVKLGKGSRIVSSIVMPDSVVEDGAELRYVITDKDVRVTAGAKIIGEPDRPRILIKGQTYSE